MVLITSLPANYNLPSVATGGSNKSDPWEVESIEAINTIFNEMNPNSHGMLPNGNWPPGSR